MRIIAVRVKQVAAVMALSYAALSPLYLFRFAYTNIDQITVPLGIVAPLFDLSLKLHVRRPSGFVGGIAFVLFTGACYALTGWLTGAATALLFNVIARQKGGIEANAVITETAESSEATTAGAV